MKTTSFRARRPAGHVLLALIAVGCATTSRTGVNDIEIAEGVVLLLPDAGALTEDFSATQLLTATYEDRTYTMQVEHEWRRGSVFIAALDNLGTVAFSLSYDGSTLEVRSNSMISRRLRAENVLANIFLTFWDSGRLEPRLNGDDLSLKDSPAQRTILKGGRPVITIGYEKPSPWEGNVRFEHLERNYVLEIETVQHSGES